MLSLTCKIGIKAVIYLATQMESGSKSSIVDIARVIEGNVHTVGKMLQTLVKAQVISSSKGPNGGFYLTRKQANFPIIKIVEAIDGPDVFTSCGLGLSKCSATHPCPLHEEYKPIRDNFRKLCAQRTVNDLYVNVEEGMSYLLG